MGPIPFACLTSFLNEVAAVGFSGVQNFPTVGLIDGVFRQNLEETGMSYAQEVEMIRLAHEKDLLTTPYVFDPQQAASNGARRRRYPRRAHGPDHGRHDRRGDRSYAR